MDYMTLKQAGEKWNISPRQINYYCSDGRIPGAEKIGRVWLIPKDAEKLREFFAEHQEPATLEKTSSASVAMKAFPNG